MLTACAINSTIVSKSPRDNAHQMLSTETPGKKKEPRGRGSCARDGDAILSDARRPSVLCSPPFHGGLRAAGARSF